MLCGTTALWVTHNIEEAERHCQRVGVLSRGEFLKIAAPSALLAEFSRGYNINFSSKSPERLREAVEPLLQAAFQVFEVNKASEKVVRVAVPHQRFCLQAALEIVDKMSSLGLFNSFEIRLDRLEEVFSYLISTNHS
jgi:ABC-type multidrug transport system ATPase subunit